MLGCNYTTNAILHTGQYPYNPFSEAWTDAIEYNGQAQPLSAGAHYKVFPTKDIKNSQMLSLNDYTNTLNLMA